MFELSLNIRFNVKFQVYNSKMNIIIEVLCLIVRIIFMVNVFG